MKVLWNNPGLTSGEIHKHLVDKYNMKITTVKTHIQHLIKKNAIKAEDTSRYPIYYTKITEKEWVTDSVNQLVDRLYTDHLNERTEHFEFYGCHDQEFIKLLKDQIEDYYIRVKSFLKLEKDYTIKIYIHESRKGLVSAFGEAFTPEWVKTTDIWDIIHLAPLDSFKNENPIHSFSYSLVQILLDKLESMIPFYIRQGVCCYLSTFVTEDRINKSVVSVYKDYDYYDLISFVSGHDTSGLHFNFEKTYVFIEFIVEVYGYETLHHILTGKYEFIVFLKDEKEMLLDKWKQHIYTKYEEEIK